jgi:hypothetical protein
MIHGSRSVHCLLKEHEAELSRVITLDGPMDRHKPTWLFLTAHLLKTYKTEFNTKQTQNKSNLCEIWSFKGPED